MIRVLRLVRPAWRGMWGATGLAVLSTGCGVALLAVSAWLITRAAGMPPVLTLMVAIVGVRTFGLGRAVFRYAERLVSHNAALRALVEVRVGLYRSLERLAPATFWGSGDLLRRLSADVDLLADLLIRGVLPIFSSVAVLLGAVTVLVVLLPMVGMVVAAALVVALAVGWWSAVRTARTETALVETAAARTTVIAAAVGAASDPAVVTDSGWRDSLRRIDATERVLNARVGRWTGMASGTAVAVMGLAVATSYALARSASVGGEQLAVLVLLPLALTDVVVAGIGAFGQLTRGRAAADRIFAVLDATPNPRTISADSRRSPARSRCDLVVRGLGVQWPGMQRPAVDGIDLELAPGRRIAIVGPSGSGKSSILSALLGLAPASGTFTVDGAEIDGETRRSAMSLCDQQAYVFDSTIVENVRLARADASDDEVLSALRRAQLGPWLDALPRGMHTRVGHLGAMVSGGQRQRIAFARALLAERPILLLDEPTASLDQPTGRALLDELLDAGPDVCVVLVTHELDQLAGFDQVIRLQPSINGSASIESVLVSARPSGRCASTGSA